MKKQLEPFYIEISQNNWEYTGRCIITAKELKQIDDFTVKADGVTIEFDEEIIIK